jgi:hypothetical protein
MQSERSMICRLTSLIGVSPPGLMEGSWRNTRLQRICRGMVVARPELVGGYSFENVVLTPDQFQVVPEIPDPVFEQFGEEPARYYSSS